MVTAIVFLPLLAALISGLFGKRLGDRPMQLLTSGFVVLAAVMSYIVFFDVGFGHNHHTINLASWISSGAFELNWALRVDTLTAVMLVVVTTVSAVVHVYSMGYMSDDETIWKFHAYLSLFTFAMLMLVTADNLVQMFFGWEGVGVCSYLLIGYYYHKPSATAAAIKAFVVNRVGDFGFALGIFGVFMLFGSVNLDAIFAGAPGMADATFTFLGFEVHALTTLCLLLFIGAMGKSAQLGLHTWLPDAMEGPTPVSALIHAATMVTAGVFMVARLSPIFEFAPAALAVVTIVGALTAFVAATIGLTQFDIKRVIAYSTMSQLGYMFFALGVSAYSAAMFHLMTHAFFKALLFLGAGSVIHALHHEQDMRKMGGIRKKVPVTYAMMLIGSLALAGIGLPGVFGFAGFYSKDIILESAWAAGGLGTFAYWLGIAAALMTAFYSFRLVFLTFHGDFRGDKHTYDHAHESPLVMTVPLGVLAIGALFSGFAMYNAFVDEGRAKFWGESIFTLPIHGDAGTKSTDHAALDEGGAYYGAKLIYAAGGGDAKADGHDDAHPDDIINAAHHVPKWVKLLPLGVGIIGILLAVWMYLIKPGSGEAAARRFKPLNTLFYNKWFFDELYTAVFVKGSVALGSLLWVFGDQGIIDRFGPNGIAAAAKNIAARASRLQTGYVYHYAFAMLVGIVAIISFFALRSLGA